MRRRRTGGSLASEKSAAFQAALAAARTALAARPAALLSDLDGTLSPIVADPASATLVPGAAEALATLSRRLAVVGVLSGRAALDVRRILGPVAERLLVVGNHGLEWLELGATAPVHDPELASARGRLAALQRALPRVAGVEVEDKGLSATVHYRNAADPDEARQRIRGALAGAAAEGLEVREGRMSVEIRPAGSGDKGTAVRRIVRRFGVSGLLVAGDDVTDLDMFAAAAAARAAGVTVAIVAVSGGREVPEAVTRAADVVLDGPATFAALLRRLAQAA